MKNFSAERRLVAASKKDGAKKEVVIRVGLPYWIEEGEVAACPVEYMGLISKYSDRQGVDLIQALQIASDIDVVLDTFSDEYSFFWPSGEPYEFKIGWHR
jgi:hypothetical protein